MELDFRAISTTPTAFTQPVTFPLAWTPKVNTSALVLIQSGHNSERWHVPKISATDVKRNRQNPVYDETKTICDGDQQPEENTN